MPLDETEPRYRRPRHIIPAVVVIAFGVYFLLGNFGYNLAFFELYNWWAWLILLAAVVPLAEALERFRAVGSVDGGVIHSLLTAAVVVMVALMFLLDLSWARWWPVFVIYGGLCMLVPRRSRARRDSLR